MLAAPDPIGRIVPGGNAGVGDDRETYPNFEIITSCFLEALNEKSKFLIE
jgi:hypothetical protein